MGQRLSLPDRHLRSADGIRRILLLLGLCLSVMRRVRVCVFYQPVWRESPFCLVQNEREFFHRCPGGRGFTDNIGRLGEALDWSFDKWDPILLRVLESHPFLAMDLSEALVHSLVLDPAKNDPESARAEAIYLWLVHIFTSPSWDRTYRPRSYILTVCSESPTHWSKLLAEQLREHKDLSSAAPDAQDDAQICLSRQDASQNSATESADIVKLREHGWEPVEKWDCRPLGTTPTS